MSIVKLVKNMGHVLKETPAIENGYFYMNLCVITLHGDALINTQDFCLSHWFCNSSIIG